MFHPEVQKPLNLRPMCLGSYLKQLDDEGICLFCTRDSGVPQTSFRQTVWTMLVFTRICISQRTTYTTTRYSLRLGSGFNNIPKNTSRKLAITFQNIYILLILLSSLAKLETSIVGGV